MCPLREKPIDAAPQFSRVAFKGDTALSQDLQLAPALADAAISVFKE